MNALYLTEDDVSRLVTMQVAIDAVTACFSDWGERRGENIPRARVRLPAGAFNLMGAGYGPGEIFGVKAYFAGGSDTRFHLHLYFAITGSLVALIEADQLGRLRTGAASAVATRPLALKDASVLAVIGSGRQAFAQVD